MGETKYCNPWGKERPIDSPEVMADETNKRRKYFSKSAKPTIERGFKERGISDIIVSLVGSVAAGKAIPGSDIDCLLSRKEEQKLYPPGGEEFLDIANIVHSEVNQGSPYEIDFHYPSWLSSHFRRADME